MRILLSLLLAVSTLSAAAADGGSKRDACRPQVRDAWIRMTPTMPMGAGYFSVENRCARSFEIIGASSTRFGGVSLHETRLEQGVTRMRALGSVVVRPGETIEFRPQGRHLMLMRPLGAMPTGSRVKIDLLIAGGSSIPTQFVVRDFAR